MRLISRPAPPAPDREQSSPAPDGACEDFVRAVYRLHATPLLRYAARLTNGDWHRAEDLLQEATVRAWKHFSPVGVDALDIRPWLFTVIRNLSIDHHRRRAVRLPESPFTDDTDLPVPDAVEAILTTQVVIDALSALVPAHREIIALLYHQGHTAAEAAERLGIPVGTAKSRSSYALRALREILQDRGFTHAH
ncbi:sigma-70 family RNA polymerase sigma factor [Streptomyces hawaiiensis]|uniref:sigma-70 family RNA polymerase sigma factor n=1 Tax=Streptomyces hawaiiensis TaxID=67305 RepID=UPI00365A270C